MPPEPDWDGVGHGDQRESAGGGPRRASRLPFHIPGLGRRGDEASAGSRPGASIGRSGPSRAGGDPLAEKRRLKSMSTGGRRRLPSP